MVGSYCSRLELSFARDLKVSEYLCACNKCDKIKVKTQRKKRSDAGKSKTPVNVAKREENAASSN